MKESSLIIDDFVFGGSFEVGKADNGRIKSIKVVLSNSQEIPFL